MRTRLMGGLLLLMCGFAVDGQDTGWITGTVLDPTGAAVAKATVNLMLQGGAKPVATTVTTSQGLFTLQSLRPVSYDLTIDAPGFEQYKQASIKIDPSRPTDLPTIKLKLAATTSTITVTSGLETVQTTSPEISTTFTQQQLERLPVGDRNPLGFIGTQAGVSSVDANGIETQINGERSSFSNVTLDGVNIQDNYIRTGGLDFTPNQLFLSQVQEFTVITSNQGSASAGGASQVNFTTPSGGNQYHGSAFWQNRNNKFAANDFFDNLDGNPLPRLNLNQAGIDLGGPIKKDKLFFYGTYELYRVKSQQAFNATILTDSARNGIFKYLDTNGQVQQTNVLQDVALPTDPVMNKLLAQLPDANHINNYRVGDSHAGQLLNTAGYSFLVRNNDEQDNAEGKFDYYIDPRNSITATYAWNRLRVDRPDEAVSYNGLPAFQNDNAINLFSAAWRTNPRPTLTNEFRVGMNLAPGDFGYTSSAGPLPSYFIGGTIYSTPDALAASPTLAQGRNTRTYSIQDNATWNHGRHTFKFGTQYQAVYVRTYDYTGTVPTYNVGITSLNQSQYLLSTDQLPGLANPGDLDNANGLLASLAGLLDNDTQTLNVTSRTSGFVDGAPYLRHFTLPNLAFYGQDEWKILPHLTLTAGVRWDYYAPVNERDSLELQPVLTGTAQETLLNPDGSLDFSGNSVHRPFYNKDLNNFAPTIGLAWDPFGKGTTSIRAGYSVSYVNDEAITVAEAFTGTNPGISAYPANFDLAGFVSTDRQPITAPYQVPLSFSAGYNQNPTVYYGLVDPNLRTPYVQQWNVTIQHEFKNTIFEARYVANHATKLMRGFDYNQEQVPSAFLADFKNARQNGFLAQQATGVFDPSYDPRIKGSQPLPVFNRIDGGGFLTDGTVQSDIQNGEVAELGYLYQISELAGPYSNDPALSFFPNPNALSSLYLTNFSNSTYNSLQLESRHRFSHGLEFQANYTFQKTLSDGAGTDQLRFEPFMDINNTSFEKARTPTDITHQFKANYSYDLPFGQGHGHLFKLLAGGWTTSGTITWTSGPPFSVLSGLGTFLREDFSGHNEANVSETYGQLSGQLSLRMSGDGPYIVPASAISTVDNRGAVPQGQASFSGQLFYNPGPGQVGSLQKRIFNGPNLFNMDAKLAKGFAITEHIDAQLYMEALNVFNHPSFLVNAQDINSPQFGRVDSQAFLARELELGLKIQF